MRCEICSPYVRYGRYDRVYQLFKGFSLQYAATYYLKGKDNISLLLICPPQRDRYTHNRTTLYIFILKTYRCL